jgi:hypothetical protein
MSTPPIITLSVRDSQLAACDGFVPSVLGKSKSLRSFEKPRPSSR